MKLKHLIAYWKYVHIRSIIAVCALLVLAGCGEADCIDADDWGYPKVEVPSHYEYTDVKGEGTEASPQVAPPVDSGQILIDAQRIPIVVTLGDGTQWTSWFGGQAKPSDIQAQDAADQTTTTSTEESDILPNPNSTDLDDGITWDAINMVPDRECLYMVKSGNPTVDSSGDVPTLHYDIALRNNNDPGPMVSKARRYKGLEHTVANQAACPDRGMIIQNPDNYADCRVPCYMRYGMGLYVGFAHDDNPNSVVVTRHIPDAKYPEVPYNLSYSDAANRSLPKKDASGNLILIPNKDAYGKPNKNAGQIEVGQGRDGYLIRGIPEVEIPYVRTHDHLFFKIMDTLYTDNFGYYTVQLKEGTRSAKSGPIESIVDIILTPIFDVMKRLWVGLTQNTGFIGIVRIGMELAVTLYALSYLMGMISAPKSDFVINVVRLGIVIQLLTPDSFDFFYNHFFQAFLTGIADMVGFIVNPFTDYDPNSPWYSLDQLLHKLWSQETAAKVLSTLFSNGIGMFYIPVFYIGLVLFLLAIVKALLRYLAAMIILAILVVLGPIFITLMLYGRTRGLFDEWVNQFVAVAIELLLLFAAVGMFAYFIVFFMEQTLGYRVCWKPIFTFEFLGNTFLEPKFWFPEIRYDSQHLGPVWTDANNDGLRGINEFANRYYDLPYFDLVRDKAKIVLYASERNFLNFSDILLFIGIIFLMDCFLEYIPNFANAMKGASASASASVIGGGQPLPAGTWMGGGGKMWDSAITAAIGAPNSATNAMKNLDDKGKPLDPEKLKSTRFGERMSRWTGRDGGILGGAMRGLWEVKNTYTTTREKGLGSVLQDGFKSVKGGGTASLSDELASAAGLKRNPNYGKYMTKEGKPSKENTGIKDPRKYLPKTTWESIKGAGQSLRNFGSTLAEASKETREASLDSQASRPVIVEQPKKPQEPEKLRPPVPSPEQQAIMRAEEKATVAKRQGIEEHKVTAPKVGPADQQMFNTEFDMQAKLKADKEAFEAQKAAVAQMAQDVETKRKLEEEAKNIRSKLSPSLNLRSLSEADIIYLYGQYGGRLSQEIIDKYKPSKSGSSSEGGVARSDIQGMRPPPPKIDG